MQAGISFTLAANVENLVLTGAAAINGWGNLLANTLTGNAGANTLSGLGGDDVYFVGAGDTVVEAVNEGVWDVVYTAADRTIADNVEAMVAQAGANLTGNPANNALYGLYDQAANTLAGAGGNDTYYIGAGDSVTELAGGGIDTVQSGIDYVLAAEVENLVLTGTASINGGGNALANTLTGNAGANTLTGKAGDDVYYVGAGDTVVEVAGEGVWDVVYTVADRTIADNVEAMVAQAGANLAGNPANNNLYGVYDQAANTLSGGTGDDVYHAGAGDSVTENPGAGVWDVVYAYANRTIDANVEALVAQAGANITGDTRGNALYGGFDGAANTMQGGAGNDNYYIGRGGGADAIVENDATAGNTDIATFLSGVTREQVWFRLSGNDLEASIIGTTDKVTVKDWYLGDNYHVEQFKTVDGNKTLLDGQVAALVSAMSAPGVTMPAFGTTSLVGPAYSNVLSLINGGTTWQ